MKCADKKNRLSSGDYINLCIISVDELRPLTQTHTQTAQNKKAFFLVRDDRWMNVSELRMKREKKLRNQETMKNRGQRIYNENEDFVGR